MAGVFLGVGGVARKAAAPFLGVGGVARKGKAGFVGVNGVARQCFSGAVTLSGSERVYAGDAIPYGQTIDLTQVKRITGRVYFNTARVYMDPDEPSWGWVEPPEWWLSFSVEPEQFGFVAIGQDDYQDYGHAVVALEDARLEVGFENDGFRVSLSVGTNDRTAYFPDHQTGTAVTVDYELCFER